MLLCKSGISNRSCQIVILLHTVHHQVSENGMTVSDRHILYSTVLSTVVCNLPSSVLPRITRTPVHNVHNVRGKTKAFLSPGSAMQLYSTRLSCFTTYCKPFITVTSLTYRTSVLLKYGILVLYVPFSSP